MINKPPELHWEGFSLEFLPPSSQPSLPRQNCWISKGHFSHWVSSEDFTIDFIVWFRQKVTRHTTGNTMYYTILIVIKILLISCVTTQAVQLWQCMYVACGGGEGHIDQQPTQKNRTGEVLVEECHKIITYNSLQQKFTTIWYLSIKQPKDLTGGKKALIPCSWIAPRGRLKLWSLYTPTKTLFRPNCEQ